MTICILNGEDIDKVLKLLESIFGKRGIKQDIYVFEEENEVLLYCAANKVHVAIISEKARGFGGYELAYILRKIDKNILPIILRSEKNINERAGEAELFGCITLDNMDNKLPELIGYAAKRIHRTEIFVLSYYWNGIEKDVDINHVIYFCSNHRVVEYKGIDGTQGGFYQKLDTVEALLLKEGHNFVRIGKSFLVNRKYIMERNGQEIVLINGERLLISRKYKMNLRL